MNVMPEHIGHLVFDWDGTLIAHGIPEEDMYDKLSAYLRNGIHITIITGRSTGYVKKEVLRAFKKRVSKKYLRNLNLFSEMGAVEVNNNGIPIVHENFKASGKKMNVLSAFLKQLFREIELEKSYELPTGVGEHLTYLSFKAKNRDNLHPYKQEITKRFRASQLKRFFKVSSDKYGIHFYPIGSEGSVTKKIGLVRALKNISQKTRMPMKEIVAKTLIFGDRYQDAEMTRYRQAHIPLVFLGSKNEYDKLTSHKQKRIVTTAIPLLHDPKTVGRETTKHILDQIERQRILKPLI